MNRQTEFLNSLLGGKASLEEEKIKSLNEDFKIIFEEALKNEFVKNEEELETIKKIFASIVPSQLAHDLMKGMPAQLFYDFGNYLNDNSQKDINEIIYSYLNVFRFSEFLERIYDERKWDDLIYQLIITSNFTVEELFSQRVNDYGNKTLFKILKGSKVINYSFETISNEIENTVSRLPLISRMPMSKIFKQLFF